MNQPWTPPGPNPYSYPSPPFGPADQSNLTVLAILYFVYGGLFIAVGLVFLIYVVIGAAMVLAPGSGGSEVQIGGGIVGGVGVFAMALLGLKGLLWIIAGACLRSRRLWILCLVVGGLTCLNFPLGTVLGVFTLVHLFKPQVKAEFERVARA